MITATGHLLKRKKWNFNTQNIAQATALNEIKAVNCHPQKTNVQKLFSRLQSAYVE